MTKTTTRKSARCIVRWGLECSSVGAEAAKQYDNDNLEDRKFTVKLGDQTLWTMRPAQAIEAISIPCEAEAFEIVVNFLRESNHEGCFDPRMYTKSGKYQKQVGQQAERGRNIVMTCAYGGTRRACAHDAPKKVRLLATKSRALRVSAILWYTIL